MRLKLILWALSLLLLGAGGIFVSQRGWMQPAQGLALQGLAPLQQAFNQTIDPLAKFFDALVRVRRLEAENERQREELARLSAEIATLREAEMENQRLRALLHYKEANPGRQFLVAAVIGRDPTNLVESIIIDKGSRDGLQEGMVVVAEGALAAKLIQVSDSFAKALLITDPTSSVNAMVQSSRALGVVKGWPGSGLVMEYVAQGEEVQAGDLVVTSGLGGGFPQGLLIGQVVAVEGSDVEMFQRLEIKSPVGFQGLEEVMVITNFTPFRLEDL